jgi:hypothetical protein
MIKLIDILTEVKEGIDDPVQPGILKESVESELKKLEKFGYKKIDLKSIGNYTLVLLHNEDTGEYEVALTSFDQEFTTSSSQKKKKPASSKEVLPVWRNITEQLNKWIDRYKVLTVGSFNKQRVYVYLSLLSGLGLNVGPITHSSADELPDSWNFQISKH